MRHLLLLLLLALVPQGLGGQALRDEALPVRAHTLDNGLRLLVLPRSGAPTVSFVVQYRVGSVNEPLGSTGVAHLLEHLFFKGTTTVGTRDYSAERPLLTEMDLLYDSVLVEERALEPDPNRLDVLQDRIEGLEAEASTFVVSNEFDAILSENGARNLNATTSAEATTYFLELPANRAELWFVLEADRMRNPVFREFYAERDVVAEERRLRLETSPAGLLYEAHLSSAFHVHPYGHPVIGYMQDIQSLTRGEVEDFFHRFYGPNNAVVAVVGDVDPDRTLRWARKYLEPVPPGPEPPPVDIREPEQRGERRTEVLFDAEPILRIGWKVPDGLHPDAPALAMLSSILTAGRSSRLYRRLITTERMASTVTSTTGPGQLYPGLFIVEAYPMAPHAPEDLERAIYEEVERLKASPPEERELVRVRNQLEASLVRRLRSNFGLALQLANAESLTGDWRDTFRFTRRMADVTPADIQRVVRTYFTRAHRTVATLAKPGKEEGGSP